MGQTPAFYFVGAFYFLRCLTHQVNALSMLCTCDSSTRAFHVWFEGRSTLGPSLSKFILHFFWQSLVKRTQPWKISSKMRGFLHRMPLSHD